jgi:hypothetical protein
MKAKKIASTHNDVGVRQVLEQLHFFFELFNMSLATKGTSYQKTHKSLIKTLIP